ncbi:MAG: hypothetical protein ACYSUQ_04985, partial [Planctomycetota bacterium]
SDLFNDPGTGWHLRTGQQILSTGQVPQTDQFSYTREGHHWVETQWLVDVLMSLSYDLGGYSLMALCTAVVIAILFRWIYRTQATAGGWPTIGLIVTLVAACAASGHFLARPLVASSVGVPLSFWWASQYARGRMESRRLWLLVPITAFWTNCHPGVLGGIATVAICGIGVLIGSTLTRWAEPRSADCAGPRGPETAAGWRRGGRLLLVAAAMGAATLVNPYGLGWHAWVASLMSMEALGRYVNEWLAPAWNDPEAIAAAMLVVTLVIGTARNRKASTLAEVLVIVFWTIQAAGSARHVPLLGMIVALQLGRVLTGVEVRSAWLRRWGAKIPLFSAEIRLSEARRCGGLVSVAAVAVLLTVLVSHTAVPALGLGTAGPPAAKYSPGAVAWLRSHRPTGALFNDLNYGGTLVLQLPEVPIFADDRFGLYGDEFLEEYRTTVLEPHSNAARLLDRWRIQTVLIGTHLPLCGWLADDREWTPAYRDAIAAVYTRRVVQQGNAP